MPALINITGQKFGSLTVIEMSSERKYGKVSWVCACDCGKTVIRGRAGLNGSRGPAKSCGCRRAKDIAGKRFGKLVVIEKAPKKDGVDLKWVCKCDCGNEAVVVTGNLTSGGTKSCGCICKSGDLRRKRPLAESAKWSLFRQYQRGAEGRGIIFEISEFDFYNIVSNDCFYCGARPVIHRVNGIPNRGGFRANGIDRVDNSQGYVKINCVPCCGRCNRAKNTLVSIDFIDMCAAVYNNLEKKWTPDPQYLRGKKFTNMEVAHA